MADKDLMTDLAIQQLWSNCVATFGMSNGILLWQNLSPTSAFAETTLTDLPDLSQFKYLLFGYKDDYGSDKVERFIPIKYAANAGLNLNCIAQDTTVQYICSRYIKILSSTSIKMNNCYKNQAVDNIYLTPTRIYGTNDLGYQGQGEGVPTYDSSKANYVLSVDSNGDLVWKAPYNGSASGS